MFDLETKKFFVSRDVKFYEDVFPFKEIEGAHTSIENVFNPSNVEDNGNDLTSYALRY